jgi:hypothetical protein
MRRASQEQGRQARTLCASYLLIVTSFGGLGAVNLSSARLDARDQLSTELDRVV